jgi:thioredoxin reductase
VRNIQVPGSVIAVLGGGYAGLFAAHRAARAIRAIRAISEVRHPGNALKETVEHYVTFGVTAERTIPGVYHWAPGPKTRNSDAAAP